MRRDGKLIERLRENRRRRGLRSQAVQRDARLSPALARCVPDEDCLVFELATRNPRTGREHVLEIWHEAYGGTDRFAVVVDGERWRNGWSRSRFAKWIFEQVDSVRRVWE